jgi:prepilin-type processing-associated H-X9-DG protein
MAEKLCWFCVTGQPAVGVATVWFTDGWRYREATVQACERHAGKRFNCGFTDGWKPPRKQRQR